MSMKKYLGMKVDAVKERISRFGEDDPQRIDGRLPLNVRMGSRIRISEAPFLLAGNEVHVRYPGEEALLGAFSELQMAGLKTFRFYLEDRDESSESAMLMVLMDDNQAEVDEIYLFREQYEIPMYFVDVDEVTENDDETNAVNFWVGESEGILGMPLFHTPDELTYERLWENDRDSWISPLQLSERINLDPYGEKTVDIEHVGTMLYARSFDGIGGQIDEYLLPTLEKDEDSFRVRIWVGLPLALGDIELPDAV